MPKTKIEFWEKKFSENISRDQRTEKVLKAMGWQVIILWECEIRTQTFQEELSNRIKSGEMNA